MAAPIPSMTGGAAGPSSSGDATNGSTMFNNGGLTVNRNNPWVMAAIVGCVVLALWWFSRKKK